MNSNCSLFFESQPVEEETFFETFKMFRLIFFIYIQCTLCLPCVRVLNTISEHLYHEMVDEQTTNTL